MIYFFIWVGLIAAGLMFLTGANSSCKGSCYQGRRKCDCGKYDETK